MKNDCAVLSNVKCVVCKERIKKNIVDRKVKAPEYCYSCYRVYEMTRGNEIATAKEVRQMKVKGKRDGKYYDEEGRLRIM